ncbi:MAG: DUF4129 domain-containing protein [Xenococcaceae cyanobacterium]
MSAGSFEKNNLGWQLYQLGQRIGEWWELQTYKVADNIPDIPGLSWLDSEIFWMIAKVVFWLILALLLIWAALQIIGLVSPYLYTLRNKLSQAVERETKTAVKELSVTGWLGRSRKFQQQGNYREACLCLYMATLQRLNDSGIAPHQPSRTDGEYLQLIQQLPQPIPYQTLLLTHQQLCFGNAEASPSVFEECQEAYREIEAR